MTKKVKDPSIPSLPPPPTEGEMEVIDIASTSGSEGGGGDDKIQMDSEVTLKKDKDQVPPLASITNNSDKMKTYNSLRQPPHQNNNRRKGGGISSINNHNIPSFVPPPPPDSSTTSSSSSLLYPDFEDLVRKMLDREGVEIEVPECPSPESFAREIIEFTTTKLAWWILKNEEDPAPKEAVHPELHDDETEEEEGAFKGSDDCKKFLEEVEKMGSDDEWGDSPSTPKKARKQMEEIFGCNYGRAKLRIPGEPYEKDVFTQFFMSDEGTNYDRDTFAGTCVPCGVHVAGPKGMEEHFKTTLHQQNLKNLSLKIGESQYSEICEELPKGTSVFKAKLKSTMEYCSSVSVSFNLIESQNSSKPTLSPLERRDLLAKLRLEDFEIPDDHAQNNARLSLRYANKWSKALDKRWTSMKVEESKILSAYKEMKNRYLLDPSSHPDRNKQWHLFWERRKAELIKQGKDPEFHDFDKEWLEYWMRRMLEMLKEETEKKLDKMKKDLGLDAQSLKKLLTSPASSKNAPARNTLLPPRGGGGGGGVRSYNNNNNNYHPRHPHHLPSSIRQNHNNRHSNNITLIDNTTNIPPNNYGGGGGRGGGGNNNYPHPHPPLLQIQTQQQQFHHNNPSFNQYNNHNHHNLPLFNNLPNHLRNNPHLNPAFLGFNNPHHPPRGHHLFPNNNNFEISAFTRNGFSFNGIRNHPQQYNLPRGGGGGGGGFFY